MCSLNDNRLNMYWMSSSSIGKRCIWIFLFCYRCYCSDYHNYHITKPIRETNYWFNASWSLSGPFYVFMDAYSDNNKTMYLATISHPCITIIQIFVVHNSIWKYDWLFNLILHSVNVDVSGFLLWGNKTLRTNRLRLTFKLPIVY